MPIEPLDGADASRPRGRSLFESVAWQQVLERSYGFSFYRAHASGAPALPFATVESALHTRAVSLPFADYVWTEGVDPDAYRALVDDVRAAHPERPVIVKTTFPHDSEALGEADGTAYYHRVPTPTHDAVDANMRSSFQRGVRKARREDVVTERSTSAEALSEFYDLHRSLRFGKFGKIPQPQQFFREIRRAFFERDRGFVLLARRRGRVIGSLVALEHGDVLYYKFGASAKDALDHRPNNLLFHDLLHDAVDRGFRAVDLGKSGTGSSYRGLRRFKESFGGERGPITTFRFDPPGYDAAAEEELNDLLGRLTDTIVDHELGPDATDDFSRLLYPYFA